MNKPKILAFAGSSRQGSWNQKLLNVAILSAEDAGAEVTRLNLGDYPLPLFNEDLEKASPPEKLLDLQRSFLEHDGILIASPEYNSSITPLMKNTIDWVSRVFDDLPPCAAYKGKVAGLIAASPGGLGGLRGLVHLRSILQNIGVMVVPDQFALPRVLEAFNDDGTLKDEKQQSFVDSVARSVVKVSAKVNVG